MKVFHYRLKIGQKSMDADIIVNGKLWSAVFRYMGEKFRVKYYMSDLGMLSRAYPLLRNPEFRSRLIMDAYLSRILGTDGFLYKRDYQEETGRWLHG